MTYQMNPFLELTQIEQKNGVSTNLNRSKIHADRWKTWVHFSLTHTMQDVTIDGREIRSRNCEVLYFGIVLRNSIQS